MKKNFKFYIIVWAILLAIYNLTVFFIKPLPGYVINYDARFWVSWGIIIATFVGQLICAYVAFKSETKKKLFLNIPIITQSYIALILSVVAGSVLMLIPDCPSWIAVIVCAAIFGFSAISVINAKAAAEIVDAKETAAANKTLFIKSITADAESLISKAGTQDIKAELKKVYEALRYSDPVSRDELKSVENQIAVKFTDMVNAVKESNYTVIKTLCDEFIVLVDERNAKCKVTK